MSETERYNLAALRDAATREAPPLRLTDQAKLLALVEVVEAASRLAFEVRYFDDHTPEECAIVRAAVIVEGALQKFDLADSGYDYGAAVADLLGGTRA